MEYSKLIDLFLSFDKSLLISPAGYGKTYTIAECVKRVDGKSLILTHTHAGIASIKKKLSHMSIPQEEYQVETITSYAQKYVKSYFLGQIPNQDDNDYWKFVLEKAEEIFRISHIKDVIQSSYTKLFVDEYQDCTKSQHKMILTLADILPVHVLGDQLQGIMDYDEELVDFNTDLSDFEPVPELEIPQRWYQEGNNKNLGNFLAEIRNILLENVNYNKASNIALNCIPKNIIHFIKTQGDVFNYHEFNSLTSNKDIKTGKFRTYRQALEAIIKNKYNNSEFDSLLIIIPKTPFNRNKRPIEYRAELKNIIDHSNQLYILEAIDDKSFYNIAESINDLINKKSINENINQEIRKILDEFFNKTDLDKWIKDNSLINKRDKKDEAEILRILIKNFIQNPSSKTFYYIISFFKDELKFKIRRDPLYKSIKDCLLSEDSNKSVYQAMVNQRNKMRRVGRKVEGKCIGTTALTKGLEFDTAVIIDAHNFKDPKNLYVALTRASKKLIVFSKNEILKPC